jgi:hypothetical protein
LLIDINSSDALLKGDAKNCIDACNGTMVDKMNAPSHCFLFVMILNLVAHVLAKFVA